MRVAIVNDRFSNAAPGGVYRIQGIARALRELGHDTVLVCPHFTVEGDAEFPEQEAYRGRLESLARTPAAILRRLRGIRADVFLVEMPFPWTKAFVGIAKALEGEHVFLDFGEYWVEASMFAHRIVATRVIRVAVRSVAGVSVTTAALQRSLVERFGLPPDRVRYVPCGVASDLLASAPRSVPTGGPPGSVVVGYAGTISEFQGCDHLLGIVDKVLEKSPLTRFLVVGDGPLLSLLRDRAASSHFASQIQFTGRVPRKELVGLLRQMDIGLSLKPYRGDRTIGTFPQKVPEYMAVGCVPVSTPLQEAENIITPGVDGLIVDVDNIAEAIVSLAQDVPRLQRMSGSAAATARSRYAWTDLARGLVDFWGGATRGT